MNNAKKEFLYIFDLSVYSLNAVKKAAYKFSRDYSIDITSDGNIAQVTAKRTHASESRWDIEDLPNEVLDQDLREVILDETRIMRDIILAQAFSSISIINTDFETQDFENDPLKISDAASKN